MQRKRKSLREKLKRKFLYIYIYISLITEGKYKAQYEEGLKMLRLKQMLQRLPIVLAQAQPGNTSENVSENLNEIRQFIYSLHREKEVTRKVYNQ